MGLTPTEIKPLTILIVDDELSIRKTLTICLECDQHQVIGVSNQLDALNEASHRRFDMAFVDIRLGAENGLNLLTKLIEISPWIKVVMITAYASIDSTVEAMRRGAFDYIPKPFTSGQVLATVRKVTEILRLEAKINDLQDQLKLGGELDFELKSHSNTFQRTLQFAKEVAKSDATVLITGESGTGKGMLAKAIHSWSARSNKSFGVISCPSLSPELLESELFGHAKGAFTGAIKQYSGRIAGCQGGTLFLDEIGDLPISLQPKLLRFIQDHEYESVGDNATKHADVRVIAATNINLKQAITEGRFREDLYYRLNVIQIDLPPLRERQEDIPLLAGRFLSLFAKNKKIAGFSEEALMLLQRHSWPGNIRELRNVIERAVILCSSHFIEPPHLSSIAEMKAVRERVGDLVSLEKIEESHIRKVLAACHSMEEAARILDIDTVTLWRKRKKYGL